METVGKNELFRLFGFFSDRDLLNFSQLSKTLSKSVLESQIWKNKVFAIAPNLRPYPDFYYRKAYIKYAKRRVELLKKDNGLLDLNGLVETLWQFAAVIDDWELLKSELDQFGTEEIYIDDSGLSPFSYAMLGNRTELVLTLCEYYSVKLTELEGDHDLNFAAKVGGFDVINKMIESGCEVDVSAKDDEDTTLIQYAIRANAQSFFKQYYHVNMMDHYDVVYEAISSGSNDFFNWFIAEYKIDMSQFEMLFIAAECDNWGVFEKYSKDKDIYCKDNSGLTVAARSAKFGAINFLKKFVEVHGNDILTIVDKEGDDVKAIAEKSEETEIVEWINERLASLKL